MVLSKLIKIILKNVPNVIGEYDKNDALYSQNVHQERFSVIQKDKKIS